MAAFLIAAVRWAALFALVVAVALIFVRWRFPRQSNTQGLLAYWKYVWATMRERAADNRDRSASLKAVEGRTVLVVDPDEKSARVLAWQLQSLRCSVVIARSGTDAVAAAQRTNPDVVIADALLPDVSASDFYSCLPRRDGPIIFVGVLRDQYDTLRRLGRNVACFAKPYDPDEAIARAGYMLERSRDNRKNA